MARQRITPAEIPPGDLLTYYGDLASGALRPEDIKTEELSFTATISPIGTLLAQDPGNSVIQVISRYNLSIETVRGSIMNPELAGAAPSLVKFNLREQGRNIDVFKRPVDFATLLSGVNPMEWRGTYVTIPGTSLEVTWSIDTVLWPVLVGASRRLTLTIGGSYIACSPTQE